MTGGYAFIRHYRSKADLPARSFDLPRHGVASPLTAAVIHPFQ